MTTQGSRRAPLRAVEPQAEPLDLEDGTVVDPALHDMLEARPSAIVERTPSLVPLQPSLRRDLVVTPAGAGRVNVKAPEASIGFPIYEMEWAVASAMDGTKTIEELAVELAGRGYAITPKLAQSFVRELKGYGFLAAVDAPPPTANAAEVGPVPQISDEERSMLETASALRSKGDFENARNYLDAILEINPNNQQARNLLQVTETRRATPSSRPSAPERASDSHIAPVPERVSIIWVFAAVAVTAVSLAAFVIVARQPISAAEARETTAAVSQRTQPEPPTPPATERGVLRFQLPLEPSQVANEKSPIEGTVRAFHVAHGSRVTAGDAIAEIVNTRQATRLAKLQKEYKKLRAKAQASSVYADFAEAARMKVAALTKRASPLTVRAARGGVVTKLFVAPGATVGGGDDLLSLADIEHLQAELPVTVSGIEPDSTCTIGPETATPGLPCRVALSDPSANGKILLRVHVDNARLEIAPGQVVQLTIRPPSR